MLKIFKDGKGHPILNRQNFNIVRDYEGALTLSFDIRTNDKVKEYLQEEAIIQYRDNFYKIKTINQRKAITSITATLDTSEWRSKMFIDYDKTYALFSEVMLEVAPKDWIIEGAGSVTGRRAIHIEGASAYEILMNCKSLYGIVYEYHIAEKRIKVIKPDVVQSRGLYITDELNLKDLEFKGSSSNLCTRLYARGKKTETKDEEGNTTSIEYVNFASINGGKIYVDNNDYSDNVIALYWQDDRYTDSQSLLDDAIEKLKSLASPERSYSCTLMDLSRTNDKYKMLDFQMYDKVTLMDNVSKTCLQHQIVQYTEYPDDPNKNEVVLSSVFKKITGTIDGIKQSVSDIDTEVKRTENSINEIIRDVASNTARIKNTYTKGETDTQIESVIQQTSDMIDMSISTVNEKIDKIPIPQALPFPPENAIEGQIWIDITMNPPTEKIFSNGEWVIVGDYTGDLENLLGQLESLNTSLSLEQGKIETLIKDNTTIINGNEVTLKQAYSYMKQEIDAIQFAISESGGNNKLLNSCGWNGLKYWNHEGDIVSLTNVEIRNSTISGYAFLLNKGHMEQSFKTIVGRKYSVSCKIKKFTNSCTLVIKNGTSEDVLFNLNEEYEDGWISFSIPIEALDTSCTVYVESSGEYLYISDIMVNDGEISQQWSSSNDEIYTANVKIDREGIEISQDDTNNRTVINTNEFAGYEGSQKVFSVNGDVTEVNRLKANSDVQIGVVRAYAKTTGSKKGLGFAYIKGGSL